MLVLTHYQVHNLHLVRYLRIGKKYSNFKPMVITDTPEKGHLDSVYKVADSIPGQVSGW